MLAALFVLGDPVDADDLGAALPTLGLEGAARLGLVEVDCVRVRPAVDLRPYGFIDAHGVGEWWIASDLGELATGGALDEDHVLGVGGASATLSGLMISSPSPAPSTSAPAAGSRRCTRPGTPTGSSRRTSPRAPSRSRR